MFGVLPLQKDNSVMVPERLGTSPFRQFMRTRVFALRAGMWACGLAPESLLLPLCQVTWNVHFSYMKFWELNCFVQNNHMDPYNHLDELKKIEQVLLTSTIYWKETFTYIFSNSQNNAGARHPYQFLRRKLRSRDYGFDINCYLATKHLLYS